MMDRYEKEDIWFSIFLASVLVFFVTIFVLTMDGGTSMVATPIEENPYEPQKQDERWVDDDPRR